jgi:hypothetical protein
MNKIIQFLRRLFGSQSTWFGFHLSFPEKGLQSSQHRSDGISAPAR